MTCVTRVTLVTHVTHVTNMTHDWWSRFVTDVTASCRKQVAI